MRDRLIELIEKWYEKPTTKYLADYLLENGVIALPCKVGDDLYWIDEDNTIQCQKNAVKGIMFCADGKWKVMDTDGGLDEIGTRYAYLSREEAEQALTCRKSRQDEKEGAEIEKAFDWNKERQ